MRVRAMVSWLVKMTDFVSGLIVDGRRWVWGVTFLMLTAVPGWTDEWSELTPEQRRVLSSYESRWSSLSEDQRRRLQLGSQRWLSMDEAKRREAVKRFQRWQSFTPDRRELLKRRLDSFRSLTPEQQRRVRSRLEQLRRMDPETRQRLRRRFESLSPEQRAKALGRMRERAMSMPEVRGQTVPPPTANQRMSNERANTRRGGSSAAQSR